MKIRKINKFILIIFAMTLLLSSCNILTPNIYNMDKEDGLLNIDSPDVSIALNGKWTLMKSFKTSNASVTTEDDASKKEDVIEEIFISKSVFEYGKTQILNPKVTARYVRLKSYLISKTIILPEDFNPEDENVVVYKFLDDRLKSQELMFLKDNKILAYNADSINIYERYSSISQAEESEKTDQLIAALEGTDKKIKKKEYSLSIGVRKNNGANSGQQFDYQYQTFFIGKTNEMNRPQYNSVNNIVFAKDTTLWSVEHDRSRSEIDSNILVDRIAFNPSLAEEDKKLTQLQERVLRRIDYVNDNYIAMTLKDSTDEDKYEYYEIQNINQLSKNQPLRISNIGGVEAKNNFKEIFNDTVRSIAFETDEVLDYTANETNIGLKRDKMSWKFISSIEATIPEENRTTFRSFALQFIPIIDIANDDNQDISWRDVKNRVSNAVNAIVAPDGNTIVIQSPNKIDVFTVHNYFIAINPEISIMNTEGMDIIMTKWYAMEDVDEIRNSYEKLPRLNTTVLYPVN